MKYKFPSCLLVVVILFVSSCATVEKSQVVGNWSLQQYQSPDAYFTKVMMQQREKIYYQFTDSMAYFKVDGKNLHVNLWDLDHRELVLSSANGLKENMTEWKIVKVDDNNLILKANNESIGKRVYVFSR